MRFTILSIAMVTLSGTMTLTSGAPIDPSSKTIPEPGVLFTPAPKTKLLAARENRNDCAKPIFMDQTSAASPKVNDCWRIIYKIHGGGTWTVWGDHRTLATYGTRAFGAEVVDGISMGVKVGNEDVRDLVPDSIKRFGKTGVVGAMV
ncbi:hypothetical protein N657DRAFT_635573 [Parathielavia appendiculata]|uniref:Ecp2 effector protein-like domain-containing protein n=1 Tax=Parathielavia appendiculata TaxID=2587402 RepID=A0AAN6TVI9_9PEZI|nr:hypothetical protein N657DRAFT_635573 [Parathielavia appendiculata]